MKERPILFSAPMVRAILAGTKTQTRRVVKPEPAPNRLNDGGTVWVVKRGLHVPHGSVGHLSTREKVGLRCPYGRPGDLLWVREAWRPVHSGDPTRGALYRADAGVDQTTWLPSIHMPRWASRITLEVTGVRVERLRDISEADAIAEGAPSADLASGRECIFPHQGTHRWGFQLLWESIHGPGSWDANPWVWVLQFRRMEQPR